MNEANWTTIQDAVIRELGEGATSLTAHIERYRKLSLRDIAAFHQWSWLEFVPVSLSTDSGQNYITVPGYFGKEISVYDSGAGKEIEYIDPTHYGRLASISTNTTTKPDYYTIIKNRMYFYMSLTAGESVTVIGTIDHNALTDDDATPLDGVATVLPNDFQQVIEWDILRRLDSDNRKKGEWATMYFGELNLKKKLDQEVKGRKRKGKQDRVIRASRIYTGV